MSNTAQASAIQTGQQQKKNVTAWAIDPAHTTAEFVVRHMLSRFRGRFKTVSGTIERDEADVTRSRIFVEIDAASVDTGTPDRDGHLRSKDFFDVENHPTLSFRSTRIERVGDNEFTLVGDLTIRGVTREVAFDAEFDGEGKDAFGTYRAGASAKTKINRKDFGLEWNALLETGGFLVGDEVALELNVQAVRQG